MEDNIRESVPIKIKCATDTYYDDGIWRFEITNFPLEGKYEDEYGTIRYFKNGIFHNENGPAYIGVNGDKEYLINGETHRIDGPALFYLDGNHKWYINGYHIDNEAMETWLTENDIPLNWNAWTNEDKMLFALHWSDYNG